MTETRQDPQPEQPTDDDLSLVTDAVGEVITVTVQSRTAEPSDVIQFSINDDPHLLVAVRPKMAVLVDLLAALGDGSNPMRQAIELSSMVEKVFEPPSAQHLRRRFRDPKDDLDLDALGPILEPLVGRWYKSPTGGAPSGSSRGRARSGRSSTARRRSPE